MLTYNQRAAEVQLHLVTDDRHGYSQPHRAGDGTIEAIVLSDGTVTSVHGGDYDCSEAVRMSCVAAGLLAQGCYMWTGNEVELLTANGFADVTGRAAQAGDVLWRRGHTEMVVDVGGALMQAGFRGSETGGIDGRQGDQTTWEGAYSALDLSRWTRVLRYVGPQPGGAASTPVVDATVSMGVAAGDYACVVGGLNVREAPTTASRVVARYSRGETVTLDGWATVADGCVWGRYVGASSGVYRYVAVRTTGGMTYLAPRAAAAPAPAASAVVAPGAYRVVASALNVRKAPSTSAEVAAGYSRGQTVTLDGWSEVSGGYVWGRYTGASSGRWRYVAVRAADGSETYLAA